MGLHATDGYDKNTETMSDRAHDNDQSAGGPQGPGGEAVRGARA